MRCLSFFVASNNWWSDGFLSDMEDAHTVDLSLDEGEKSNAFFAVYDGHGGTLKTFFSHWSYFLILFCRWQSVQLFSDQRSQEACNWNGISRETVRGSAEESFFGHGWGFPRRLFRTFLSAGFPTSKPQTALDPTHAKNSSGCTAIAVLVIGDDKIYVVCHSSFILCNNAKHLTASIYQANAGDSRSVLSVKGEVKPLSFDHKPSNKSLSHSMVVMNEF